MSDKRAASRNVHPAKPAQPNQGLLRFGVFLAGLGVGWLVGLSTSPVIASVITAIVGAITALFAGLAKPEDESDEQRPGEAPRLLSGQLLIDPWPLTLLVIGLILGATVGVFARTHNWLGVDAVIIKVDEDEQWLSIQRAVKEWSDLTEKPQSEVAWLLFEQQYLANPENRAGDALPVQLITEAVPGVLNAVPAEECRTLRSANESEIFGVARGSLVREVFELTELVTDPAALKYIIDTFACPE